MKAIVTETALQSFEEAQGHLREKVSPDFLDLMAIKVFKAIRSLEILPWKGQIEPYLKHHDLDHRRIIEGHFKIIYLVDTKQQVIFCNRHL